MRLKEALRFQLADGMTVGEASADQLAAELGRYREELGALQDEQIATMPEGERRRIQSRLARMRELSSAVQIVQRHQRLHAV